MTAMYESALLQGNPAQNAAEFNTYAFIMLLVGTRQKEGPTAFFKVGATDALQTHDCCSGCCLQQQCAGSMRCPCIRQCTAHTSSEFQ